MKRCCTCRKELPVSQFCKNPAMKDSLNKQCRACSAEVGKRIRLADRLECLIRYGGDPPRCACCGERLWEFLSIDHIDGGGKAHISSIGFTLTRWLKRRGYPRGFRVLCHNCNFAIGHYGSCPHEGESDLMAKAKTHSRKRGGDRKSNNFAMMIADVEGGLNASGERPAPPASNKDPRTLGKDIADLLDSRMEEGIRAESEFRASRKPAPPAGEEERKEMVAYIDNLQANGKDLDLGMGEEIKSILLAPAPDITIGEPIQIVFDGPPAHESGRFVEVEQGGKGINFGEWKQREDGYWVLELPLILQPKPTVSRKDVLSWASEALSNIARNHSDVSFGSEDMRPIRAAMTGLLRDLGITIEEEK